MYMNDDGDSSGASADKAVLTLTDTACIVGNESSAKVADLGSGVYYAHNKKNLIVVSGSVKIADNKDADGVEVNIYEYSAENAGDRIQVAEEGLNSDAKIGVYSVYNSGAMKAFGKTVTASAKDSTNAENLACFVNDRDANLTSTYGDGNNIVWTSTEWLDLTAILPSTGSNYEETWIVVELKDTLTGEVYRQPICIASGDAGASATEAVLVRSGVPYEVSVKSNNGAWRFAYGGAMLAGSSAGTDTWSTDVASGSGASGTLTLQPAEGVASGAHELQLATECTNTSWIDDHMGVENVMN